LTRHPRILRVVLPLLLVCVSPATAHEKKVVGDVQLSIGWGSEPAFSGSRNSIDVDILDRAGKPLPAAGTSLSVQVSFGQQNVTLPVLPAGDHPGRYRAWLVPTRAGTYTFRIFGTLKGQAFETSSTCSPKTFDCVVDPADMQFPARDPSTAELADRFGRSLPRAERAIETATRAWWLAAAAMLLSACVLAALAANALRARNGARV
jgi:hypothetical protein